MTFNQKIITALALLAFSIIFSVSAFPQTSVISPPPVPSAKTHDDISMGKADLIYNSTEIGNMYKITNYGAGYLHEWMGERSAGTFGLTGLVGDIEMESTDATGTMFTMIGGGSYLFSIINGDYVEGFGWAVFLNGQFIYMNSKTESEFSSYGTHETIESTMNAYFLSGNVGTILEIPIGFYVTLVPFVYGGGLLLGEISVDSGDTTTSVSMSGMPMSYSFGSDIVFRFSKSTPDWKFSLGSMLQQVQAITSGGDDQQNLMFLASLRKDFGL